MNTLKETLRKIPARTYKIVVYATFITTLLVTLTILPFAIGDIVAPYEGWDKVSVAIAILTFVVVPATAAFFAGHLWTWQKLNGRPINFDGLTQPGTLLPQSYGFFRFIGKYELGNGWVVALFEKAVKKDSLLPLYPRTLLRKNLFCVLTEKRAVPEKPCFVKLDYDQHQRINATVLTEQDTDRLRFN